MTSAPLPAPRIRVILVDDHAMFRTALRHMLEAYADIEVVAEAADGAAALQLAGQHAPDVICVDRRLPRMDGLETLRRLRERHPGVGLIGLSACDERATVADMLAAGAVAYVSKQDAGASLVCAIRAWHAAAGGRAPG